MLTNHPDIPIDVDPKDVECIILASAALDIPVTVKIAVEMWEEISQEWAANWLVARRLGHSKVKQILKAHLKNDEVE